MTEPLGENNKTDQVKASGHDFVSHDKHIHGDEVHGDKFSGDKVMGDKQVIVQRLDPSDARNQRNHKAMRQLVRTFWVDGVLKHSLYKEVLIRLNVEEKPDAVDNRPWDLILQQPGQPDNKIPSGTPIIDVFDQMNQLLLILGEPGSGKTTTLLELADALLKRAAVDTAHPTPVVFNLSSWAEKLLPLSEWLVDELRTKYNVPEKAAQKWIADDDLLPLLDGLDEVGEEHRNACVTAINHFRQEHFVKMAVCSRIAEYEELTTQLRLQGAIRVQTLTTTKIEEYLDAVGGTELSALRLALQQDIELQRMAFSPLMLSIITLAYQGKSSVGLFSNDSAYNRQRLFDAYIGRLFVYRDSLKPFSVDQTLRWLAWLAAQLRRHGQDTFFIAQMQPSWAYSTRRSRLATSAAMLMWGTIYAAVAGLIVGLSGELILKLSNMLDWRHNQDSGVNLYTLLSWNLSAAPLFGLIFGLLFGLLEWLTGRYKEIKLVQQSRLSWQRVQGSLYSALYWAVIVGFNWWFRSRSGLLVAGLTGGVIGGTLGGFREIRLAKSLNVFREKPKSRLIPGLIFGLNTGIITWLIVWWGGKDVDGLARWLIIYMFFGLIFGLMFEPTEIIDVIPSTTPNANPGILLSQRNVIMTVIGYGLLVGLLFGLLEGPTWWGMSTGVYLGMVGVAIGGAIGGADVIIKHFILRLILWWQGNIPWNYALFLDYCHSSIFLSKAGGGYRFKHSILTEHFASLTDEDIERIASEVEGMKRR